MAKVPSRRYRQTGSGVHLKTPVEILTAAWENGRKRAQEKARLFAEELAEKEAKLDTELINAANRIQNQHDTMMEALHNKTANWKHKLDGVKARRGCVEVA